MKNQDNKDSAPLFVALVIASFLGCQGACWVRYGLLDLGGSFPSVCVGESNSSLAGGSKLMEAEDSPPVDHASVTFLHNTGSSPDVCGSPLTLQDAPVGTVAGDYWTTSCSQNGQVMPPVVFIVGWPLAFLGRTWNSERRNRPVKVCSWSPRKLSVPSWNPCSLPVPSCQMVRTLHMIPLYRLQEELGII